MVLESSPISVCAACMLNSMRQGQLAFTSWHRWQEAVLDTRQASPNSVQHMQGCGKFLAWIPDSISHMSTHLGLLACPVASFHPLPLHVVFEAHLLLLLTFYCDTVLFLQCHHLLFLFRLQLLGNLHLVFKLSLRIVGGGGCLGHVMIYWTEIKILASFLYSENLP